MGLYKVGLFLHDPLQLQDRQVVAAALGMEQRLVILFYGLAGDLQLARLPLDLIQIMVRPVILRLEIDADDPLGQRIRGLPHLIKDQSQEIPGVRMIFVELQRPLQVQRGPGKISFLRHFQAAVIVAVGRKLDLLQIVHRLFFLYLLHDLHHDVCHIRQIAFYNGVADCLHFKAGLKPLDLFLKIDHRSSSIQAAAAVRISPAR